MAPRPVDGATRRTHAQENQPLEQFPGHLRILQQQKMARVLKDPTFQPVQQYQDKSGKKRWKGTKQLAETGFLVSRYHVGHGSWQVLLTNVI